jgi:hypothetical protein
MVAAPFHLLRKNQSMSNKIVHITVEGGVIQHVECPQGVKAIVRDYDSDGIEDAQLGIDDDGNKYVETIWGCKTMPQYEIEQYELHVQKYLIEANSEAEAIVKLFNTEADPVDDSLEYVEICEDRSGLPAEEYRELADELRELGMPVDEHVIPSIRSIERVESPDTQ